MANMAMPSLVQYVNLQSKRPVSVKWSGLVTSFQAKIEKNKENHAYISGVQAAYSNKRMVSPFPYGSEPESEWIDGYLDAVFLRKL